jgi:alpha-beta hydrolase superfamily lysophospholipase
MLAMDLRAHGHTKATPEYAVSTETQVNDIVSVANQVISEDSGKAIIVGHSMGGGLAVSLVLKHFEGLKNPENNANVFRNCFYISLFRC